MVQDETGDMESDGERDNKRDRETVRQREKKVSYISTASE